MVLLPKSPEATGIKDYMPIALIQSVSKLVYKVIANCLSARLPNLVHQSQSAFIVGRYIQDNFQFVQLTAKLLHAR
jgi:hypothetical protein